MYRRHIRLVATLFALSLIGASGCKDDDDDDDGGTGTGTGTGTGDGGDDGSDDGGSGTGTGDGGDDGSDDGGTGTGTGDGTGTDTGGEVDCGSIVAAMECYHTDGCLWSEGMSMCIDFDGDCTTLPQTSCAQMSECVWENDACKNS